MNSSSAAAGGGAVDAGRPGRSRAVLMALAVAMAFAAAIVWVLQQAGPASAQISIGAIVCPILRSLAAVFGGLFASLFAGLLQAFGCL